MKVVVGIDEAGRGPVIGPLVVCGVAAEENKIKHLERLGIKDSKKLAPKRRKILSRKIKKIAEYHIINITARDIDKLRSKDINLNEIEKIAVKKILGHLNADKAIIDCMDVNAERFCHELGIFAEKVEIIGVHKADEEYPIVAAASIVAKVERDLEIEKIKKKSKRYKDIGSGYPSDPKTIAFLKKSSYDDLPYFVRKSWKTVKRIKEDTDDI
jgi:ribonuclease HII